MNKYKVLQQFFGYLRDEEEINRHPLDRIPLPNTGKKLVPVVVDDDMAALLSGWGTQESDGMTQPSAMGRPRDSSRDRAILDATLLLLTEVGYEQLPIEAVAGRSGAAKTTIYRRYRDKAALVAAAVERRAPAKPPQPVGKSLREDVHSLTAWLARSISEQEVVTQILRSHNASAVVEDSSDVCDQLGCLPLAIEQAGAYMAETGTTPIEYLDLLAQYPAAMYQETAEGGHAQRTMARIWRVTLDHLTNTPLANPEALACFRLA